MSSQIARLIDPFESLAEELYASRLDKGYSLTDCVSMEAMRSEGLIDVLTNDRHFEQEGFRLMFRLYEREMRSAAYLRA